MKISKSSLLSPCAGPLVGCDGSFTEWPIQVTPLGWIVSLLTATLSVAFLWWLRLRLVARSRGGGPHDYASPPRPGSYAFTRFDASTAAGPGTVAEQGAAWRAALRDIGARLARHRVAEIVLVHGTFVGDDPLSLSDHLRGLLSRIDPRLDGALRGLTKAQLDRAFRDAGNFDADYAAWLEAALGGHVPCRAFVWSSGNHHVARLRAAGALAASLAANAGRGSRTLVLAHSHGGQVLALLTHLVARGHTGRELFRMLAEEAEDGGEALGGSLARLRGVRLDLVTLGMPPRYGFFPSRSVRVLHLVNHRGEAPLGGTVDGVLQTRDGDYVQQWGIAGSDVAPVRAADRERNRTLDAMLGAGQDLDAWRSAVKLRARVPRDGHTLLVDYADAGKLLPNLHASGLGHAVYTSRRVLRFNLEAICSRFYPPGRWEAWRRARAADRSD